MSQIRIRGARTHCLQSVDLDIPLGKLVVLTGPSGSGKSSLAFDTIVAEGQRRLVELLSASSRRLADHMPRPDVDLMEGLPPTLACQQSAPSFGPFGSVNSALGLQHTLATLFVRCGRVHCPACGAAQEASTIPRMVDRLMELPDKTRYVLSVELPERGEALQERCLDLQRDGFSRLVIDGELLELADVDAPAIANRVLLQIDRLIAKEGIQSRLADSLELALSIGGGRALVEPEALPAISLGTGNHCHACSQRLPAIVPALFDLQSMSARCEACGGRGQQLSVDTSALVADPALSLREGAITPWADKNHAFFVGVLEQLCARHGIEMDAPWQSLSPRAQDIIVHGESADSYRGVVHDLEKRLDRASSVDATGGDEMSWLAHYLSMRACRSCDGTGLGPNAAACRVGQRSVLELYACELAELPAALAQLLQQVERHTELAGRLVRELQERLAVACDLGLGHLPLGRATSQLSTGEARRLRLAEMLSTSLRGVLFVLDEPSAGLHWQDARGVLGLLRRRCESGDSVLLVEHDRMLIEACDELIDMGPGAGRLGGRVIAQGGVEQVCEHADSLTGAYLAGRLRVEGPEKAPEDRGWLQLDGASANNLRSVSLRLPLGKLSCLVGVSGAGKTSLLMHSLYPALSRLYPALGRAASKASVRDVSSVHSDEPLGPTFTGEPRLYSDLAIERCFEVASHSLSPSPRSSPSTFTGLSEVIRDLYAKLPESRARGFSKSRFSTNTAGGRCVTCKGDGQLRVGQELFADLYVPCHDCAGRRFDRQTLQVRFRGLDIAALHELSVDEACGELASIPKAMAKLRSMQRVGLGYVQLGQPATSLSGGELQRLVLARELAKPATGHCVYLIDEASTGLHWHDLQLLLGALRELCAAGHTVVLADHHLDVMRACDYLVELGPGAGARGGTIIASGRPEELAGLDTPTGRALVDGD